ncbi:MAG: ABC transporter permease [Terriglobales bacterium]
MMRFGNPLWRRWQHAPGTALALALIVALGIGGATTMTALVRRVLVNPLGLPQPERLIGIAGPGTPAGAAGYGQIRAFAAVGGYATGGTAITAGAASGYANIAAVTARFFSVAGVQPNAGRGFAPDEDSPAARVVVLGARLAHRAFGGATQALGRPIAIGGVPFTVIGVMPDGFGFPSGTEVWLPMRATEGQILLTGGPVAGTVGYHRLIARLRPGVSYHQAFAAIAAYKTGEAAVWDHQHPNGPKMGVSSSQGSVLLESWSKTFRPLVQLLAAAMALLWLVVCANLGGVLLARSLSTQRDLAVRRALGASRRRLARLWLAEAAAAVIPGVALGVGFAAALMAALRHWAPPRMPGLNLLHLGWGDLAVLAACGLLTLALVALPPVVSLLRMRSPGELMQSAFYGSRGRGRASFLWPALVAFELAAALVLTAGAGLLLASFTRLGRVSLGFSPRGVLTQQYTVFPALAALPRTLPDAARQQQALTAALSRDQQVLDRAQRTPGALAALVSQPPPGSVGGQFLSDFAAPRGAHECFAEVNEISGDYFKLLHIPLLDGRIFNPRDSATAAPVIILSQRAAQALWPGQSPLGRQVEFGGMSAGMTVVGVVGDIKPAGPGAGNETGIGQAYIPFTQPFSGRPDVIMTLLVRPAPGGAPPLAPLVAGINGVAALRASSLAAALAAVTAQPRFLLLSGTVFTGLALVLIWLGVVALLGHWVTAHRHELAVRLALGGAPAAMARLVLSRLALMLLAAVALAACALPSESRLLAHLLFGVQPHNAAVWSAAVALVAAFALAAAALPALRAARTDPAQALRYE